MSNYPIYLDNNATTICSQEVVNAMLPYFTNHYGNASSGSHLFGWKAQEGIDIAREQIADAIGAKETEIVFTSGATEAINLALKGYYFANKHKGNHIITQKTEHKAVLETCAFLESQGAEITYLEVTSDGIIDMEQLKNSLKETTLLCAIMLANNETGVIQPVAEIATLLKQNNTVFFCDAVQAFGKVPIEVNDLGVDMLCLSAHKFHGPKGVGILYVRKSKPTLTLFSQILGGGQERNLRSGTLNVPGIVGMGKAATLATDFMNSAKIKELKEWRDLLENELLALGNITLNGHQTKRLPHVTNLQFANISGDELLKKINKSIAVSNGSACSSIVHKPSHVLLSMGLNEEQALASVRFSLSRFTTKQEIEQTIFQVKNIINN